MDIAFEEVDAFRTIGVKIETKPMSDDIPALWQAQGMRLAEVPEPKPLGAFGVMELMPDGVLHYMAALSSAFDGPLPDGLSVWDIPAGKYAVFQSSLAGLRDDFGAFYGTWLPGADVARRDGPEFESYGPDFNPADPNSVIRVFVPVT